MSLYLLSINELSETTETLKTTGYLWITWYDEFLQWDPSDYGGIDYYHWPQVGMNITNSFRLSYFCTTFDTLSSKIRMQLIILKFLCFGNFNQRIGKSSNYNKTRGVAIETYSIHHTYLAEHW